MLPRLFLDSAAALPPSTTAADVLRETALRLRANPSALHREGKEARKALDQARDTFRRLLGLERPEQIVFTSGGTEAAHLAIAGVLSQNPPERKAVVATAVEHPAILGAARRFSSSNHVEIVPCRPDGSFALESVLGRLGPQTGLVAVQAANLDSGAIHDLSGLAEALATRQVPWLCDAQALFGQEPLNGASLGADLILLSAHRFGGPKGCGILGVRDPSRLAPWLVGGRQEHGLRAGTENLPGILAAAAAAEEACAAVESRCRELRELQSRLWHQFRTKIPGVHLLGPEPGPRRIAGHLALRLEGADAESVAFILDLRGLAVGVGSGCLSPQEKVSSVFTAMGLTIKEAQEVVLMGVPKGWGDEEIARVVAEFERAVGRVRDTGG
ncbi:MAG: cysteine desulfurase NifS [Candidatus Methylacidiphilales bacterium]